MTVESWPSIAIPSYKRAEICRDRTLALLQKLGVPPSRITVFVADGTEYFEYHNVLIPGTYREIKAAEPGMGAVRRFIQRHYPEGEPLLCIDDDISALYRKQSDKRYVELDAEGFQTMVRLGFWSCRKAECRLWGIYPVLNPLFMKNRVRVGLTYIVGAFWGCFNSHDPELFVTLDDKEDFERTLKFFQKDGAVVRLEAYSLKTAYYTTPGGMQETRTPERIDQSARQLVERYPMLTKLNLAKKSGHTEVRLIDPRNRKVLT